VVSTPVLILCRMGLWSERGFGELVWELLTLGLGAPSFLVRACRGLGDREHLGFSSGLTDHLVRHALLGASVAGPDPLGLAFLCPPSVATG
jgi:hypothetical protein